MTWRQAPGVGGIFGMSGNPVLHRLLYDVADDLRVCHADAGANRMRGFAAFATPPDPEAASVCLSPFWMRRRAASTPSTSSPRSAERLAIAAFRLLLLTGCRPSEIQFLRWEYVKDDCIDLRNAKTGGRVVPLGPEARAVLANLRGQDDNPWVIADKLPGSHITDLQKPWRSIRVRAGLEDV